ncbi:putative LIM/homeobox protein Awh [Daphnia magna]|uniref:Putative LIM/homeobox protein Awh n=1 Tax=Daphnia magna TaxID=35525 RepID=A0A164YS12_9CRUS|nr:putative LIM/homeobox protein Awh [Daphnia magna]
MDTSMSPASSLHPVSPCEIKREKTEALSPSDCSIDSTSGMGVGGIGSVGSNGSVGLTAGSSGQVGVAAGVCAACGELITDRFLIQVSGRTWHSTCLRCSVCRTALDNQPSCFVRAGAIYCRADYTRYENQPHNIIYSTPSHHVYHVPGESSSSDAMMRSVRGDL